MEKQRLDIILTTRGLAASRSQAKQMVEAGEVTVDGAVPTKAGTVCDTEAVIEVLHRRRYVSRAGDKLASVTGALNISFAGKIVLDVGASTGGFTDYALQHGAIKVYCVDVGTDQLAAKIRDDERVVVMEQTDIREAELPEKVDVAVIDVSFISLTKVLNAVSTLVKPGGQIVAMMKPQFEAGKVIVSKHGAVIPVGPIRNEVLAGFREWLADRFTIEREQDSALTGAEGNLERFFLLKAK
jgi:23S rRNA (cytidine1920-2'-O)/16S rRNA (cytidine1409-2'-O)-methyltransferase